jgi:2'-5' RNA ligase
LHEFILARFDEKRPVTLLDPSGVWVENTAPPATLLVMSRLFLAVWPTANVVEMLTELPRKDQQGVRFVAPENWHATLRFLGEADIDEVCEAMNRAQLPGAVARVGPAIDMLGTHSAMAPVNGIDALSAAAVEATAGLGSLDPRPTFTGHITIARVKRGAIVRKVVGMLCRAEFDVDEVALVESRLHPDGARYATIATWPTR